MLNLNRSISTEELRSNARILSGGYKVWKVSDLGSRIVCVVFDKAR